jgi:CubicO group peptidase (beta-lactamase class C family)
MFAILGVAGPLLAQEPPDPAPTTPVDTVSLPAFEPTREEAVLEGYVDGVVTAHMREHGTPGVTVSVVKDGRLLFAKGYGVADAAGMRPVSGESTLFRIGSVSKTFIWTSVMILHERGLIELDTDVNEYLKGVEIPEAFGAPVTMNHLMAHRAGFEDTFGVFTVRDSDNISLTDALNEHMPKRVYPPGARTSYSNWGSALAAKVVEDVAGVSYEQFLTREILGPLAMLETTLDGPSKVTGDLKRNLAEGVKFVGGAYETADYMEIGPYAPAGAMASTAEDMAQWMLLHLSRGAMEDVRLLLPQTHTLMWARAFNDRSAGADMAHGFMTSFAGGVETFGHGGATSAFFTNMVLVPDLGFGVFVSQNSTNDRTLVNTLPGLVVEHLNAGERNISGGAQSSEIKAAEYTGQFFGNRRSFTQFEKLFAASDIYAVAPAMNGGLTVSHAGETHRYQSVSGAQDTFENRNGARIVFGRNEAGKVTYLSDGTSVHSYDRSALFDNAGLFNAAIVAALLLSMTTLAGAWRRQGRPVEHKTIGMWLNRGDVAVSGLVIFFIGLLTATFVVLSTASASAMLNYPPLTITLLRLVGLVLFGAAIGLVVSTPLAWAGSGWSMWRKAHHTLFALSLAFLAVMLVAWRVIFSATA